MINIIVAESHPVVRHGLNRTLGATGGFSIIAEVDTMEGLWENIGSPRADVLICETALFKRRTFETLQRIKQRRPYIPIVVFSRYVDASYVVESFRGGAMAYVSKTASADELMTAIRQAVLGKKYVDSTVRNHSVDEPWENTIMEQQTLSPRESEVLHLIVKGKRSREIAGLLGMSDKTVSTHRTRLLGKMNFSSTQQIIRHVLQQRLQPSTTSDTFSEPALTA
jgi:DNA-binding NarL/FixJ family response regulator